MSDVIDSFVTEEAGSYIGWWAKFKEMFCINCCSATMEGGSADEGRPKL